MRTFDSAGHQVDTVSGCARRNVLHFQIRRATVGCRSPTLRRYAMSDHVYKLLELTGSSKNSIEDAVQNAIAKAHQSVRNIQWFTITETRGHVMDGKVAHWQVSLKLGFTLE
jgi:flavin-binding protein dodecin